MSMFIMEFHGGKASMFERKDNNILVLGSNGMLGYDVFKTLVAMSISKYFPINVVHGLDVDDGFDFTQPNTLDAYLKHSIKYDYCINCIAHTDTNAAQNSTQGYKMSYKLNALVPKHLAESCKRNKIKLIHISTDYVFSQYDTIIRLRHINDVPFPCNVYGQHKLIGELFIENEFGKDNKDWTILRTSWLYGAHTSKSFVHKFMNVVKKTIQSGSKTVQMTSNEFSVPTSTFFVSEAIRSCLLNDKYHGILHAVPTASQSVSRLDFAKAILNSFPANTEYCGVKLTDIEIEGVVRDTYQPTYSALYTSFSHMMPGCDWLQLLEKFIHKNADELLK